MASPKSDCLKHTWTKRRRPNQLTSSGVMKENLELIREKKECYIAEKNRILARKQQEEVLFLLQKEKLSLEIKQKKKS